MDPTWEVCGVVVGGNPVPVVPLRPKDADDEVVGHWKEFPDSNMSRMRVSIGVFPTRRTKKSCSITDGDTVRREGKRRRSFPKRVGWLGYWFRQYSSRAH